MTWTAPTSHVQERGRFDQARAAEKANDRVQCGRAARVVAEHALDSQDCDRLLSMLGLDTEPRRRDSVRPDA